MRDKYAVSRLAFPGICDLCRFDICFRGFQVNTAAAQVLA